MKLPTEKNKKINADDHVIIARDKHDLQFTLKRLNMTKNGA